MMRWGMPPPPKFGGAPVTNIRNMSSPHGRGWFALNDNRPLFAQHRLRRMVEMLFRVELAAPSFPDS
jgi:hypothetical protein